jgi:hypothetical protein
MSKDCPDTDSDAASPPKTYTAIYAVDVPHYGTARIEAPDDTHALAVAKAFDTGGIHNESCWEDSLCERIVSIEDASGAVIAYDIPLDKYFLRNGGEKERRLCDAASAMLEALQLCEEVLSDLARLDDGTPSVSALNMARDAILKATGDQEEPR